MRRWIPRILVCLILGAITTVAVAWALSYYQNLPYAAENQSSHQGLKAPGNIPRPPATAAVPAQLAKSLGT